MGSDNKNHEKIIRVLDKLVRNENLSEIKKAILKLTDKVNPEERFIHTALVQISETHTFERTKYYIERLIKSLTKIKHGRINEINLNRWKEYEDILTDSLWVLNKRDNTGVHSADYWGNFIPQIPNQFIRRYTKRGENILDPFAGCGTTLIESQRLERNAIGIELQKKLVSDMKKNLLNERNPKSYSLAEIIQGDCTEINYEGLLSLYGLKSFQLIIMHPPYHDIIKFSNSKRDLSNCKTTDEFLNAMYKLIDKTYSFLDIGRYLVLVIGDKYEKGRWIPLGFYLMQKVLERGYQLKSIIVKNFDATKGKMKQKELWRYRALVGEFFIFKHEYIFLFKKVKQVEK